MSKIKFGIIGGGWRSEFFLRIAAACPDRFEVTGVVVRDSSKGEAFGKKMGVNVYPTLDGLLEAGELSFVVVSVSWASCPVILEQLAERGVPALSETPPAPDLKGLQTLYERLTRLDARVQVAEQYPMQPLHAARQACIEFGKMGPISQVQVSVAHGYHGIALMRRWLGVGFESAVIRGLNFQAPLIAGPNRQGPPTSEQLAQSKQLMATLQFESGKLGVFDFTGDQYFSYIRAPRVLIRGERGELVNDKLTYLLDHRSSVELPLIRRNAGENGNLEGYYLKGITAGDTWVYENPLALGRLADDEIAIANCLLRMEEYVRTGRPFYSLAEASQDHYLSMLMNQAAETGETLTSEKQIWAE